MYGHTLHGVSQRPGFIPGLTRSHQELPMPRLSLAVAALVAIASACVDAHNYVVKPLAEFRSGTPGYGDWVAEFKPPFSGDVSDGRSAMALMKQNGFQTVRAFIENRGPDCGYSNPNAKAKAIPSDGKVMLYRSMDHPGPCELWLDNSMVYHNDDCQAAFGGATPGFNVNFSACKGSCQLRFYWLGLQDKGQRMQSYKNCIPLSGNGGGNGGGNSNNGNRSGSNNQGNKNGNNNQGNSNQGNLRSDGQGNSFSFGNFNGW